MEVLVEMDDPNVYSLLQKMQEVLGIDSILVFLGRNRDQLRLIISNKGSSAAKALDDDDDLGEDDDISGKCLKEDQKLLEQLYVDKRQIYEGNRLFVPIMWNDEACSSTSKRRKSIIGVIKCERQGAENDLQFSEKDLSVANTIASMVGNSVHKMVLYDELLTAKRKVSALLDLANASRRICRESQFHLPNLIDKLLLSVYRVMRADRVSLYLCDTEKRELWCCISKDYKYSRIAYGVGIIGQVANNAVLINVPDCYRDHRSAAEFADKETGYQTRSMIACPVRSSANDVIAVLAVINKIATPGSSEPILSPVRRLSSVSTSSTSSSTSSSSCAKKSITPFTAQDELVIECIAGELGRILEKNALDSAYERELAAIHHSGKDEEKPLNQILTTSLLADTTRNELFRESAALVVKGLKKCRSKHIVGTMLSPYLLLALGKFVRIMKRNRGFHFDVHMLDDEETEEKNKVRDRAASSDLQSDRMVIRQRARSGRLESALSCSLSVDSERSVSPTTLSSTLEASKEWCMDIFELASNVAIEEVWPHAFDHLNLIEYFSMDPKVLGALGSAIKDGYLPSDICPYHNWEHGFAVFQMSFAFICQTKIDAILGPVEMLALLVASFGHDIGHEGRTNDFEIKLGTSLAIRYNDRSVLEQHHAATLFQLLRQRSYNILAWARQKDVTLFRKQTIDAILATDMAAHFENVKNMSCKIYAGGEDPFHKDSTTAEKSELISYVLHCLDIGTQCYPPNLAQTWSDRLLQEFSNQAKQESLLGFQPAPYLTGLDQTDNRAKLQLSFTEKIVKPAYVLLNNLFPSVNPLLCNLQDNIAIYKKATKNTDSDK